MECKEKVRYANKKEAKSMINWIATRHRRADVIPTRAYHCIICNGWHLTSDMKDKGNKLGKLIMPDKFEQLLNKQQDEIK